MGEAKKAEQQADVEAGAGGTTALWVLAVIGGSLACLLLLTALGPLSAGS